jgi:hypothetical protein
MQLYRTKKIEHAGGEDHLPSSTTAKIFLLLKQLLLIAFERLLS